MRLQGKKAIVTGGASGFGEGIVRAFVAAGAQVVIADLNSAAADRLATDLGEGVYVQHVDVSVDESVAAMVVASKQMLGGIDILGQQRRNWPCATGTRVITRRRI